MIILILILPVISCLICKKEELLRAKKLFDKQPCTPVNGKLKFFSLRCIKMLISTFERCWKDDFVTAPYCFILFPVFMLSLANRLLHLADRHKTESPSLIPPLPYLRMPKLLITTLLSSSPRHNIPVYPPVRIVIAVTLRIDLNLCCWVQVKVNSRLTYQQEADFTNRLHHIR